MDVRDLRYVRELAVHGNFSRAADALGLTQPALTRRIQAVEAELEVRLFDRHAKGVKLTPFGDLVVERAEELLRGVQNVKVEIDRLRGLDVGHVSLGAGPVVAQTIVGEAIGKLIKRRPGIQVSAYVGGPEELPLWLRSGKTDLMISDVTAIANDGDVEIVSRFEHVGYFFCAPQHPILQRQAPSVEEILSYPFATAHLPPSVSMRFQEAIGGRRLVPAVECDNYPILKMVVASSDAIGIASRYAIIEELRAGRLVEVPTKGPAAVTALGVARLAKRAPSPAADALAKELTEHARKVLEWSAKARPRASGPRSAKKAG
jgi:DNA-binding transcriptional LysR family regulator